MTEEEAKAWLRSNFNVSRGTLSPSAAPSPIDETWEQLEEFVAFLKREAMSQNLIAASTLDHIWSRHIVDSAQLLKHIPAGRGAEHWLDLGSGAGFPGIVAAILTRDRATRFTLVESRARRIDYLHRAIALLGLESRVTIAGMAVERLETAPYSVISARAFAPLPKLLTVAARFSTANSLWLLPKGRNADSEYAEARRQRESDFTFEFTVQPSITDADAGILVGRVLRNISNKNNYLRENEPKSAGKWSKKAK